MEKTIAVRIDDAIHRQIRIRLAENGMTLKDYILHLINTDLKDQKPIDYKTIPTDNLINENSVREAQKVLNFVSSILAAQEKHGGVEKQSTGLNQP